MNTTDCLRYLNRHNFSAVVAQMLDLFPQGAILHNSHGAWRDEHRLYSLMIWSGVRTLFVITRPTSHRRSG